MAKVTVYNFKCYDIKTDKMVLSKHMGTREYIKSLNHGCVPIEETAKEVDASGVDAAGQYC